MCTSCVRGGYLWNDRGFGEQNAVAHLQIYVDCSSTASHVDVDILPFIPLFDCFIALIFLFIKRTKYKVGAKLLLRISVDFVLFSFFFINSQEYDVGNDIIPVSLESCEANKETTFLSRRDSRTFLVKQIFYS